MEHGTRRQMDDGAERPVSGIFGLRYLEEEEAEIHDVVGCLIRSNPDSATLATGTGCDDSDNGYFLA